MDLAALKKKHRFFFGTEIGGKIIYWRPLTLEEHNIYQKILLLNLCSIGQIQDNIFREIVLDPFIIDQMNLEPPGIVASIVNTALSIAGTFPLNIANIDRINYDIATARNNLSQNIYDQFITYICRAFPTYKPFEVEKLEYQEFLRLLMMSESILCLEEPLKVIIPKEKSLTKKIFQDSKMAEKSDMSNPPSADIRDILRGQQEPDLNEKQARQIEMIKKIQERRGY